MPNPFTFDENVRPKTTSNINDDDRLVVVGGEGVKRLLNNTNLKTIFQGPYPRIQSVAAFDIVHVLQNYACMVPVPFYVTLLCPFISIPHNKLF